MGRGIPLGDCSGQARGHRLSRVIREVDERLHAGAEFADAIAGERADGGKRAPFQAQYSWQRDGARVACKSGALMWEASLLRWTFRFTDVKPAGTYDELLLAAYTPKGLYVYRHDGRLGLSKNGVSTATTGRAIHVYGPRNMESWQSALDGTILPKLDANCERVAQIEWS